MLDVSPHSRRPNAFAARIWRAQMSDRELSDLGLLRADIADCTALPLDDDPGERLARARAVRAWYGRHHDKAA